MGLRSPTSDLLDDMRVRPDPEIDISEYVCEAMNRHKRLWVASYMLSDGSDEGDRRGLREAYELYDNCGQPLLDRPGPLTVAQIAAEVYQLVSIRDRTKATGT